MRGFRVRDVIENRYSDKDFFISKDGKLYIKDGIQLKKVDTDRYIVEEGTTVEGLNLSAGDIISVNGKHEKIVGFDEYGLFVENVSDIKNRNWMDTKQRPNKMWWSDFKREIKVVGTIHDNPELLEGTE